MNYGAIYKITNKEDGKCYIGKTTKYMKRIGDHSLKFDPKDHTFEILAEYDNEEDLENAEKYWIFRYNSYNEGYNKNIGGVGRSSPKINKIRVFKEESKEISKFKDFVKQNGDVLYITIPKKEAKKLNLKKGDPVENVLTKIGGNKQ